MGLKCETDMLVATEVFVMSLGMREGRRARSWSPQVRPEGTEGAKMVFEGAIDTS